jgi:hypothetical protein
VRVDALESAAARHHNASDPTAAHTEGSAAAAPRVPHLPTDLVLDQPVAQRASAGIGKGVVKAKESGFARPGRPPRNFLNFGSAFGVYTPFYFWTLQISLTAHFVLGFGVGCCGLVERGWAWDKDTARVGPPTLPGRGRR